MENAPRHCTQQHVKPSRRTPISRLSSVTRGCMDLHPRSGVGEKSWPLTAADGQLVLTGRSLKAEQRISLSKDLPATTTPCPAPPPLPTPPVGVSSQPCTALRVSQDPGANRSVEKGEGGVGHAPTAAFQLQLRLQWFCTRRRCSQAASPTAASRTLAPDQQEHRRRLIAGNHARWNQ